MVTMDFRYEEDEDDLSDDEGGRRRRRGRVGKSRILKTIRRRISVVGRSRRDDDEEEDDYSSEDEEGYGGFLKRKKKKSQQQQATSSSGSKKKSKKHQQQQQQVSGNKRGSIIGRVAAAGGGLRASSTKSHDEDDDVAMPLPGQRRGGGADDDGAVSLSPSHSSSKKSTGLRRIKNALVNSRDSDDDNNTSGGGGGGSKKSSKKKKGKSGGGKSSPNSTRQRQRRKSTGSDQDRSVDTPPSVASTEYSVDMTNRGGGAGGGPQLHQHAELRLAARQQRKQSKNKQNGLPGLLLGNRRDPDEMTQANMEAMSLDYYYQSISWIIKTWIYFLTVVVPFTLLYYCFVGIFHSTTLHQNPLLQHVAIANLLFSGLGCNFRFDFWYRQTLDSKGVMAKRIAGGAGAAGPGLQRKNTGNGRRIPRRTRSGRGGFKDNNKDNSPNNLNRMISVLPRVDTLRMLRPRRKTLPQNGTGTGVKLPSLALTSAMSSRFQNMNSGFMSNASASERGTSPRRNSRRLDHSAATIPAANNTNNSSVDMSANSNMTQQTSNTQNQRRPSGINHQRRRPSSNQQHQHQHQNHQRRRPSSPTPSPFGSSRAASGTITNNTSTSSGLMGNGSSASIWDVENMIPTAKQSTKTVRPSINKHTSILEIYEVHAKDEKVALLQ